MIRVLTHKELKRNLHYNPTTGIFTWKKSCRSKKVKGEVAGYISKKGYVWIRINRKNYSAAKLAWFYQEGYMPENIIDHEDRVRDNNKWKNLRHVSISCNNKNRSIQKNNKSGVTGVHFGKRRKKWVASIRVDGSLKTLCRSVDIDMAVQARWEAENKYDFQNCNSISTAYLYLKDNGLL